MDTTNTATVRYRGRVPATLRRWIDTHAAEQVYEVTADTGHDFGDRGEFGYDAGIRPGWCLDYYADGAHFCVEHTVRDMIAVLKTLRRCVGDCGYSECRAALGLPAVG